MPPTRLVGQLASSVEPDNWLAARELGSSTPRIVLWLWYSAANWPVRLHRMTSLDREAGTLRNQEVSRRVSRTEQFWLALTALISLQSPVFAGNVLQMSDS